MFFWGGGRYITCLCRKNSTGPNIARAGSYVCSVFASISDKGTNVIVQRIIVRDERSPSRDDLCCIIGSTNPCRITRKVEQTKYVHMYIEEFILVDVWIHCCTSWN